VPPVEQIILTVALLLLLSVGAAYASGRFGVPALVLFLAIGMLAGSDGPGGIAFDSAYIAQGVGVVALLFILYAGGLDTNWARIRPVLAPGLVLANVGVIVSAAILGLFGVFVLGFSPVEGLLLGAIVSSTDAAAVFSILRMQNIQLRGRLEPLIELESGTNDPVAVLLTAGLTTLLVSPDSAWWSPIPTFFVQMGIGAVGGYLAGRAMVVAINRIRLSQEGLYSVLSVALVLFAFGVITLLQGNGFLAVYVAGLVVGNSRVVHKGTIVRFHDGISWLMQITMFLTLGLLVFPSQLPEVALAGLATALFLTFVARPLSVVLTLFWARLSVREMAVVSWAGLRGAVPIVLATFPLLAGVEKAPQIFNIIFFVVVVSVLLQGTTLGALARRLGLNPERPELVDDAHAAEPHLHAELIAVTVPAGAACSHKPVFDLGLPPGVLVVQIHRGAEVLVPSGATVLQPGDHLMILGTDETPETLGEIGFVVRAVSPAMAHAHTLGKSHNEARGQVGKVDEAPTAA
jgi:cell volume regulation protein A